MKNDKVRELLQSYNFRYIPFDNWVKTHNDIYYNISYENQDIFNKNRLKIEWTDAKTFDDYKYFDTYKKLDRFLRNQFKHEYRIIKVKSFINNEE